MSSSRHSALIHVSLDLLGGVEGARKILKQISDCGRVEAISSVYKRYLTPDLVDLRARLEFVVLLDTSLGVDQALHLVLSQCSGHSELTLLVFDHMVMMSPRLTLPYPQLHLDPLIIRCAAEAWAQYEHPIYQKSLSEISRSASPVREVEFYMQGKSLVDF